MTPIGDPMTTPDNPNAMQSLEADRRIRQQALADVLAVPNDGTPASYYANVEAVRTLVWLHAEAAWLAAWLRDVAYGNARFHEQATEESDQLYAKNDALRSRVELAERERDEARAEVARLSSGDTGWAEAMTAMDAWALWHADRAEQHGDDSAHDAYASVTVVAQASLSNPDRAKQEIFVKYTGDTPTPNVLREAFERAARMVATNSRDWGLEHCDAWLYGLLCGWDCEDTHDHDDLCNDGAAMRELAVVHGWSDADVARLRRYRAAIAGLLRAPAPQPEGWEVTVTAFELAPGQHERLFDAVSDAAHAFDDIPSVTVCADSFPAPADEPTEETDRA